MRSLHELIEKIRAALDETERIGLAAADYGATWSYSKAGGIYPPNESLHPGPIVSDESLAVQHGRHIALHDPQRELEIVAAHREILELHEGEHYCPDPDHGSTYFNHMAGWAEEKDHPQICPTVRALARLLL